MTADRSAALEALLARAKAAHAAYELAELGGVYDEQWPRWYAEFLVDAGLPDLIGRPSTAEDLAAFLRGSWAEQQKAAATESWERYTAQRIAADL